MCYIKNSLLLIIVFCRKVLCMKICMMSLMMYEYKVEDIISVALQCGMEAIDWIGLHNCRAEYLKKLCDDRGLYIASHTMLKDGFVKDHAGYFDEFKSSLDDARIMGAPIMMIPPFPREKQTSMADDLERYVDYYGKCCEYAEGSGVTITVESTGFRNSPVTSADECLKILRQIPELRLTFDQGNVATADDPFEAFKKLRQYVVHFHIKDWKIFDTPHENADLKRCNRYFADTTIGEGDMDIKGFWQLTSAEERECYVNLETRDFSGKRTALETYQKVCAYIRSWEK